MLAEEVGKPDLEAVLAFYEVPFVAGRQTQMVNCPLHEDRTPSLSVNLTKELWKCHSCGKGGDSWTLIELKEEVDFLGACEFVKTTGIECDDSTSGSAAPAPQGAYCSRRSTPSRGAKPTGRYRPRYGRGTD